METPSYASYGFESRSDVDAAAEREAAALDWMAENLGQSQPRPLIKNPLVRNQRYARTASILSHERLSRAPWHRLVWGPPAKQREITTAIDRARRVAQRAARDRRLRDLEQLPADRLLTRREAAGLAAMGERTIDTKLHTRELPRVKLPDGRTGIRVADLTAYLRRTLAA